MKLVTIDLQNTYELTVLSESYQEFSFQSTNAENNLPIDIKIVIQDPNNLFIDGVFNLAFGPPNDTGIDDKISLRHKHPAKVYSTIAVAALTFLNNRPSNTFLGVDGSDKVRAYLYYRLIQHNYDLLSQFFKLVGVKYYIRLLRGKTNEDNFIADNQDLMGIPSEVVKGQTLHCDKLFNYYVFRLIPS